MRAQTLLLPLALAVVAPGVASATPNFPAAIARDLQLSGPPACTICHASNDGGAGTVVKPFGKYLVSRGLAAFDEGSLGGALAAASGEGHDSDGDGVLDVDALKQGLDPNGSTAQPTSLEDPTFGCSTTGAGGATNTLLLVLVMFLRLVAARMCRKRGLERAGAPDGPPPGQERQRSREAILRGGPSTGTGEGVTPPVKVIRFTSR